MKIVLGKGHNEEDFIFLHESLKNMETPEFLTSITLIPNNFCIFLKGLFSELILGGCV